MRALDAWVGDEGDCMSFSGGLEVEDDDETLWEEDQGEGSDANGAGKGVNFNYYTSYCWVYVEMILLPQKAGVEGESASVMMLCTRCQDQDTPESSAIANIAALNTPIAR